MKIHDCLSKIENVSPPEHWKIEEITSECRLKTKVWVSKVYNQYGIVPDYVLATVETGIYLSFRRDDIVYVVEIDNKCESASIINNNKLKKIIGCFEDIDLGLKTFIEMKNA